MRWKLNADVFLLCLCLQSPAWRQSLRSDGQEVPGKTLIFLCFSFFNLFSWLSFYTDNFPAWKQVFWIPIMQPGRHTIHELVCQLFSDQKAFSKWARSTTIVWTAGDWEKENWNFILWHLLSCYETWLGMEWGIWGLTRKAFVRLSGRYYIIAPFSPHQVVKV